jgi:hypothetical protein
VVLLRLRHQLTATTGRRSHTLLVEESTAVAWRAGGEREVGPAALHLLSIPPSSDPPVHVRKRELEAALASLAGSRAELDQVAQARAEALLADHRRVREAADARGSYAVKALLPADQIGVYVLLPEVR